MHKSWMLQIFNLDIQCICSSSLHSEDTARLFLLSILDALCSECPTILVSAVITLQEAPFILDSSPDRNQGWLLDLPLLGKNTNYSMSVSLTRLDPSADEALNNSHQVWLPWCKGPPYLWLTSKWYGLNNHTPPTQLTGIMIGKSGMSAGPKFIRSRECDGLWNNWPNSM